MKTAVILSTLIGAGMLAGRADANPSMRVGSKSFTESVILGELVSRLSRDAGARVVHKGEVGGTQILWQALIDGELDVYPEYTGTIVEEIFAGQGIEGIAGIRETLAGHNILMIGPLGFSNHYILGMTRPRAAELGVGTISDLLRHPELRFGFSNEFMARADGWPGLRDHYALPHTHVRGMNHDIAYRGLVSGAIDVTDLYSTDAEIEYYDLATLEDDLAHFPSYEAVLLYRADLQERAPRVVKRLESLDQMISKEQMIQMNKRAKIDKVRADQVAADFLADTFGLVSRVQRPSLIRSVWRTTREHLGLLIKSMLPAILVAVPLGIWAAKRPRAAQPILGTVGAIQTIPALALLVLLMTLLKPLRPLGVSTLGDSPAIVALFLYSLLPIVRNTYTGLHDIAAPIRESAAALGLPPGARLRRIELPIASRSILGGIKIAAVMNVGFATLGALIGAGGYGQPILAGVRLDDTGLILQGAIPSALLALAVQGLFDLAERKLVPKGLRLPPAR